MNSKIFFSGMSIVAALTLMGGSAFAAFTSQATSAGNTFSVGNADLRISTDTGGVPTTFASSTIPGFSGTGFFPGESRSFTFWLKNVSTSVITLDTTATLVESAASDAALKGLMNVSFSCQDLDGAGAVTNTGTFSVNDWETGLPQSIGSLSQNESTKCVMTVALSSAATSSLASGAAVNFDGVFDGNQAP